MSRNRSNASAPAVKGNIVVGTGTDTSAVLPVGADGTILKADSTQTSGVVWTTIAPSSGAYEVGYILRIAQGSPDSPTIAGNFAAGWYSVNQNNTNGNYYNIYLSSTTIAFTPSTISPQFFNVANSATAVNFGITGLRYNGNFANFGTTGNIMFYGGGYFVAGDVGGSLYTSTDGINWTNRISGVISGNILTGDHITPNAYGSTPTYKYVVSSLSSPAKIVISTNGITWSTTKIGAAFGISTTTIVGNIAFGNNVYVAAAQTAASTNQLAYSSDGANWTGATFATSNVVFGLGFGNGLFVASGTNQNNNTFYVKTSTDGINWTSRTNPFGTSSNFSSVQYKNNLWLASGNGLLATSTDGITWTQRTLPPVWITNATTPIVIEYGNGYYIIGKDRSFSVSTDAITWRLLSSGTIASLFCQGLVYTLGKFWANMVGAGVNRINNSVNATGDLIGDFAVNLNYIGPNSTFGTTTGAGWQ